MTVKKKAGSKSGKVRVKDLSDSPKSTAKKNEKDDPKGGGTYSFTQAWPKKY